MYTILLVVVCASLDTERIALINEVVSHGYRALSVCDKLVLYALLTFLLYLVAQVRD